MIVDSNDTDISVTSGEEEDEEYIERDIQDDSNECKYYPTCLNPNCQYIHRTARPRPICQYGNYCSRKDCRYIHDMPRDIGPGPNDRYSRYYGNEEWPEFGPNDDPESSGMDEVD